MCECFASIYVCIYVRMCTTCVPGTPQKRALDFLELVLELDGCEPPYGRWALNPGSLQEQEVFLTAD